jgi:hypothetical protein
MLTGGALFVDSQSSMLYIATLEFGGVEGNGCSSSSGYYDPLLMYNWDVFPFQARFNNTVSSITTDQVCPRYVSNQLSAYSCHEFRVYISSSNQLLSLALHGNSLNHTNVPIFPHEQWSDAGAGASIGFVIGLG